MMNTLNRTSKQFKWPWSAIMIWVAALTIAMVHGYASAETSSQADLPLWEKTLDYLSRNRWIPGSVIKHELKYDLNGEPLEASRLVLGYSQEENGRVQITVIAASENGRDVTKQLRPKIEGDIHMDALIAVSQFAPLHNQQVAFRPKGEDRHTVRYPYAAFHFDTQSNGKTMEGTIWLDRHSGLPIEMQTSITSVPFMVDGIKVIAYHSVDSFTRTLQGHCLLNRTKIYMQVETPEIGFKGRVVKESVYTNHWKFDGAK